ncbi:MAG: hypothetical protein LBE07_03795 [Gordonia sp. (in: high G+C Gram-positive bacteria)]|jgi:hypothetical protein|nr:hypothetical protein [Gordonia sp. (in: high G+C Gram-positive bacteria)]
MRKPILAAAIVAAAAGVVVPAVAHAAPSASTDVTFIVVGQGGDLSITAGPLGTIVPNVAGTAATGALPPVSVSDNRNGSPRAWTTTASSTDFVSDDQTIPKSAVTYTANAVVGKVGGGTLASTGTQTLDGPKAVVNRSGLTWPLEVVTWSPALNVAYPGGASIGTYSGTITVSVA